MMDNARYQAELTVLRKKLPVNSYQFLDMDTAKPYVMMAARTNGGKLYTLRIELSEFPTCIPRVYVNKMLYTKSGEPMNSPSGAMHTLTAANNRTCICHYGSNSWNMYVSIYKIYVKCRLWLEMYELHLQTGKPLDYYLKHQS